MHCLKHFAIDLGMFVGIFRAVDSEWSTITCRLARALILDTCSNSHPTKQLRMPHNLEEGVARCGLGWHIPPKCGVGKGCKGHAELSVGNI